MMNKSQVRMAKTTQQSNNISNTQSLIKFNDVLPSEFGSKVVNFSFKDMIKPKQVQKRTINYPKKTSNQANLSMTSHL
jgi:hypothetical protein